jgi:hypothetical protein
MELNSQGLALVDNQGFHSSSRERYFTVSFGELSALFTDRDKGVGNLARLDHQPSLKVEGNFVVLLASLAKTLSPMLTLKISDCGVHRAGCDAEPVAVARVSVITERHFQNGLVAAGRLLTCITSSPQSKKSSLHTRRGMVLL